MLSGIVTASRMRRGPPPYPPRGAPICVVQSVRAAPARREDGFVEVPVEVAGDVAPPLAPLEPPPAQPRRRTQIEAAMTCRMEDANRSVHQARGQAAPFIAESRNKLHANVCVQLVPRLRASKSR